MATTERTTDPAVKLLTESREGVFHHCFGTTIPNLECSID